MNKKGLIILTSLLVITSNIVGCKPVEKQDNKIDRPIRLQYEKIEVDKFITDNMKKKPVVELEVIKVNEATAPDEQKNKDIGEDNKYNKKEKTESKKKTKKHNKRNKTKKCKEKEEKAITNTVIESEEREEEVIIEEPIEVIEEDEEENTEYDSDLLDKSKDDGSYDVIIMDVIPVNEEENIE